MAKSKTKYTQKRPRPLNKSEFARLVGVTHTAIGGYVNKKIIKIKKGSKRFNPLLAREALKDQILQGLQIKMNLDFEVDGDGECYQSAEQLGGIDKGPEKPVSDYPDANDVFTDIEKSQGLDKPPPADTVQGSFDYDKLPATPAAAQMRKMIIDADHSLIKLRALQGSLFDPEKYIPDFEEILSARDKGIADKILESIDQTVAHVTGETDSKKVREIQTKIIHGVLKNIVTLSIIDYLPEEMVERIRAAGLNDGVGVVG